MTDRLNLKEDDCIGLGTEGSETIMCPTEHDRFIVGTCESGTSIAANVSAGSNLLDISVVEIGGEVDFGAGCRWDVIDDDPGRFL